MPAWPLPPSVPNIYPSTVGGLSAPTLADLQFKYNGLTFGAGQDVGVLNVSGLGGLPTVNGQDQIFPRDTGEYVGVDAMGGRDPAIDMVIKASLFTELESLGSAFFAGGLLEQPLWFQLPGLPTLCSMVRPRLRTSTWDTLFAAGKVLLPSVTFHATDPRLYTQAQIATSPSSGSRSVSFTVTNGGNCEVRPVLVLKGPLAAPTISNAAVDSGVKIAFSAGTTIGSGDAIVIDTSTPHTVRYWNGDVVSGGASSAQNVYGWIDQSQTSWWNLLPGANPITCTSATGSSLAADHFEVWWPGGYIL